MYIAHWHITETPVFSAIVAKYVDSMISVYIYSRYKETVFVILNCICTILKQHRRLACIQKLRNQAYNESPIGTQGDVSYKY